MSNQAPEVCPGMWWGKSPEDGQLSVGLRSNQKGAVRGVWVGRMDCHTAQSLCCVGVCVTPRGCALLFHGGSMAVDGESPRAIRA